MYTLRHLLPYMLMQQFFSPDDVNSTAARPEPEMEWPEGDLPEQMGGTRTTILPGIHIFQLPADLSALWDEVAIEDGRPKMPDGSANATFKQKLTRKRLKFDRNHPLVVIGGPFDGEPMTVTWTSNPRVRGRKDDPKSQWISDLAYLYTMALKGSVRTKTSEELRAEINRLGGNAKIRLETGLSAQCRPDRVRRVRLLVDGQPVTVEDPTGTKGCGTRYYTTDFKNETTGKFDLEIGCTCGEPSAEEAAAGKTAVAVILRGYENVERFMPPM